jgi:hypothetical protein
MGFGAAVVSADWGSAHFTVGGSHKYFEEER